MPTIRPRHQITETPDVAAAIDRAARRWPHEPRSRLLVRLVLIGGGTMQDADQRERARRQATVERTQGALTGVFGPGYLDDLRRDWPA